MSSQQKLQKLFSTADWESFQSGDEKVYKKLYDTYFNPLYNYAFRYTNNNQIIEDALHDLFLKLWKNKSNLKTPSSIPNYLFTAFRRQLHERLKKNTKTLNPKEDDLFSFDLYPSKESEIIQEEETFILQEKVSKVLNRLTNRQREAVFLRYYEGFSYPEIAEIMGLTKKATYKLIGRAIQSLRKSSTFIFIIILLYFLIV